MEQTTHLPAISAISLLAPFGWLASGWTDFRKAPTVCLIYGAGLAAMSASLAAALYLTGSLSLILVLAAGFLLVAPMLAIGLYEAARMLEQGETPSLGNILLVRSAFRRDLIFLGLALMLVYSFWVEAAHLVYGLSTYQLHNTPTEFLNFIFSDPAGIKMALIGSAIGGIIAFLAYSLVVISAPMLLNEKTDVFIATITSVRCVAHNFLPMLVWALIIASLTTIGIATGFLGLIIVFPVIGLASWRAYRELVSSSADNLTSI